MKRRICNISIFLSITGFFIFLAVTDFFNSYLRLGEVFRDLGQSIKLYFYMIIGKPYYGDVNVKDCSEVIKNNIFQDVDNYVSEDEVIKKSISNLIKEVGYFKIILKKLLTQLFL